MAYQVTQNDLSILRQGEQRYYVKVELLNRNLKILDSIEGNVINDSYSVDKDSVQRRSYSFDMVVTDSSFTLSSDSKIWMDKRVRVYFGMWSLRQQEIVWYKLGVFAYVNAKYTYNQTTRTLSLTCADMMALYDGTLNGQIGGYGSSNSDSSHINQGLKVLAGEDIRASVIATLKHAQIENYIVEDIGKEVPYDLEFQTGVTYQEVWKSICGLYDGWEYFFDVDGNFVWRQIPTCLEDEVIINDDTIKDLIVDESTSVDYSGVYNVTEIWGKVLELEYDDRYAETSTYENNIYNINLALWDKWEDIDNLTMIAFGVCENNLDAPYFTINGWESPIPIYDGNGDALKADALLKDTTYVFRLRRLDVTEEPSLVMGLFLLGQFQCYGKYVSNNETDPDNPFNVDRLGEERLQSLDYSGLSDDAACYNQAEYNTYYSTAMQDTITLTTMIIPWLDVNQKIEYTPYYNNTKAQYIIKNMSWSSTGNTMTLTLYKFVESFSFVYRRKHGGE